MQDEDKSQGLCVEELQKQKIEIITLELLKNSEERFRSVAQSATDAIVCSDGCGNITFWNKAAELIFGYPADEALGKPLTFIMPERFRAIHQAGLNRAVLTGNSNSIGKTFEVVGLRKDNSEFPLELSLATWSTEEGTFFTGIIRDIGERKRAEEELRASEDNYRTIFDAVNDAIFVHDIRTGDILDINRKACEMYGYTSEEARWLNVEALSAGKAHYNQEFATQLINKAVMGEPQLFEWRAKNKSGILFWVEVNLKRVVIGGKFRLLAVVRDITERKRAEDAMKESKEFFEKVVNTAKALIVGLDISGKIVIFNAHCEDVTGWKREEAMGKHWLTNFVPSQYWSQLGHVCKKTVELGDGKEYEYPVVTKAGEERMVAWNNTILLDASGEISLVTCTGIDITERKLAQDMLQRLSSIDGLTGIANRRYFDQYLEREWRRGVRSSTPFSLVMCDIDYFKAYNDTYGHQGGDDCLKKVAATIKSTLKRPGDLVARYGGEEFVIVMPETNVNGAAVLAESLRAGVEALGIAHANSQVNKCVTISLGVATIVPSLDSSPEELLSSADKALYRAKKEGRNRVKLFRP